MQIYLGMLSTWSKSRIGRNLVCWSAVSKVDLFLQEKKKKREKVTKSPLAFSLLYLSSRSIMR